MVRSAKWSGLDRPPVYAFLRPSLTAQSELKAPAGQKDCITGRALERRELGTS